MAHVSIERLGPGHRQHRRTHRQKALERIVEEQVEGMVRAQRPDYLGALDHAQQPQHGDHRKVDQHDRPKQCRHLGGPAALDHKQEHQNADHQRHHQLAHRRIVDRHAFDRTQHRHRRGNHAVAIEQRSGEHAQQDNPGGPALARDILVDQRQQGQAAALTLVIGPHDHRDVFDRHDDHHRPEHQADDAKQVQNI